MTSSSVVLPAPLGPMMTRSSLRGTARLRSLSAVKPPNWTVTSFTSSKGATIFGSADMGQVLWGRGDSRGQGSVRRDPVALPPVNELVALFAKQAQDAFGQEADHDDE